MKKTNRYCQAKIAFELPDWFPPERLNYQDGRHGNSAEDALFRLVNVRELITNSAFSPMVIIDLTCNPKQIPTEIAKFETKLERFLRRYKEYKELKNEHT